MKKFPFALAVFAALSGSAFAAPQAVEIDTSHTRILYFINHLGFSEMYGDFGSYNIDLQLDTADLTQSSVKVSIDTASVDMRHGGLNDHLKAADFFNVAQFPSMQFESTGVTQNGEGKLAVAGNLTLLGVTKPVTLDVTVNKIGEHPMRKTPWVGFGATATIKRSDFGLSYAVPAVGDEVKIQIALEGGLKAE